MKKYNFSKGRRGEIEARLFLESKGYIFVDSNFSVDIGEIDLVMSDKNWLVFVEVKYKSDDYMGKPEDMIDNRKLSQVRRVAEIYLLKNFLIKKQFEKYRIDAVCILGDNIKHYENLYV